MVNILIKFNENQTVITKHIRKVTEHSCKYQIGREEKVVVERNPKNHQIKTNHNILRYSCNKYRTQYVVQTLAYTFNL